MKYYLHRAEAKRTGKNNSYKITEYTIQEFDTYKKALETYRKDFLIYGEDEPRKIGVTSKIAMRISTTKKKIKAKLYKSPLGEHQYLSLVAPTSKYRCYREFLETEVEYGLCHSTFLILETNYKKACDEFLYEMKKFEDKRNSFYVEIEGH